jgi:hypothetical protein
MQAKTNPEKFWRIDQYKIKQSKKKQTFIHCFHWMKAESINSGGD